MNDIKQLYEKLNLSIYNGLILVREIKNWTSYIPEGVSFSSKVIDQLTIIQPDSFYHFNNTPLILFFENPNEKDENRIHSQGWCFNQVPVIFILKEGVLNVYNAFHYERKNRLKKLEIENSEIYNWFSLLNLQSGTTWSWIEETFYKKGIQKYRVDKYLLNNIRLAINKLEENGLQVNIANKIILRLIFSRYLIDRGVIISKKYVEGEIIDRDERKKSFNKLIRNKKRLYEFFKYLKDRFNGNLFDTEGNEDQVHENPHLNLLADLFEGDDLKTKQQVLFDVYDFSIIPIELISGIYESVIDEEKRKENSAIYTPVLLVEYILNNTVGHYLENNDVKKCKVLDPACGSGIFLVEAYRRMVEKEKTETFISDKKLTELLENNIYGIDKDGNALNVAIFSLYIALLDYKEPKDINKLNLPQLFNKNLFEADFFDTNHKFNKLINEIDLKFIIGNPPWGSKNSKNSKKNQKTKKNYDLHTMYIGKGKDKLPVARYEISQTFLLRIKDFNLKNTKCALIVTSKSLYNLKAENFRKYFLENFFIDEVFDLSPSRFLIFEESDNPAAIIFYRYADKADTKEHIVKHLSLKPNIFLKYFNSLVIEKYDINNIKQNLFLMHDWLWKVVLYGCSIDFRLLAQLKTINNTLETFIENEENIYRGDGILKKIGYDKKKDTQFKEILNLPKIETQDITDYYSVIDVANKITLEETYLKSGDNIDYYKGKKILFKARTRNESHIVISFTDNTVVYKHCTFGISSNDNEDILYEIYGLMLSKLYTYYQFLTSSNWGVFYPEIALEEYLSFPYAEIKEKDTFIKSVKQFINHYRDFYSQKIRPETPSFPQQIFNKINKIVNKAYKINEVEKDMIDYVLNVSRYLFQEKRAKEKALRKATDNDLKQYAQIFYNYFSTIYDSFEEFFQIEYFNLDYFIAMKFKIVPFKPKKGDEITASKEKNAESVILKELAQRGSIYNITNELYINKVINGFEDDFFYIIKPNELKSWHRAIAHLDLAEFIDAIDRAESEQMTGDEKNE